MCDVAPALAPAPDAPDWLGSWDWRAAQSGETVRQWAERVDRQEAEIRSRTAAWLRVGRMVRILHDAAPKGSASLAGRLGAIDALVPIA